MAFGLTPAGFVLKRLPDILGEIESDLRDELGNGIDLTAESPLGQINGIYGERLSLLWELAEAIYNSGNPDTAEGVSLDNVGALLSIKRKARTYSKVNALLLGTPGTLIEKGKKASVVGNPSAIFVTDSDVTIGNPIAQVQRLSFYFNPPASGTFTITFDGQETAPIAWNATAGTIQTAMRALSNISDDLTVSGSIATFLNITFGGDMTGVQYPFIDADTTNLFDSGPNMVHPFVTEVTAGQPAQVAVAMTAEASGPVLAPPGSLTNIVTAVAGWTSVTNPNAAAPGSDLESDPQYRMRRASVLQRSGSATLDAIRSRILTLNTVTDVRMFENTGLDFDDNGLPAKSFRALVQGGNDQQIGEAIWSAKPAGITADGNVTISVTDSQGYPHDVKFARPELVSIEVKIEVYTTSEFGDLTAGEAEIKARIVEKASAIFKVGEPVYATPYLISALDGIEGISFAQLEVKGPDDVAFGSTVFINVFELAFIHSSNIEVEFL